MKFKYLPSKMQLALQALKDLHNTPEEMGVQVVLGVVNLVCQGHYNVDTKFYGVSPISLFLLGLAPTGALKSTNFKELTTSISKRENEERLLFPKELEAFKIAQTIYEREKKKYIESLANQGKPQPVVPPPPPKSAKQSKLALNNMLANLKNGVSTIAPTPPSPANQVPLPPKPIQTHNYRIGSSTINGIKDQLKTQPMVGLFSAEAGEFFNGHSFANGAEKAFEMTAVLTSMWDGSPIQKRTQLENFTLYNRRVNMLFLLQENMIRKILSDANFSEQGFTHRLLITQCKEYATPDMDWEFGVEAADKVRVQLQPFHDRIYELISKPFPMSQAEGQEFELEPTTLQLDMEAGKILAKYRNLTIKRSSSDLFDFAGFALRAHEHSLRLAATMAAFEGNQTITVENAMAAVELMEFYIEQRLSLELMAPVKDATKVTISDKLVKWVKENTFDGTLREFRQRAPFGYRKFDDRQRQQYLEEMVSTGEVEIYTSSSANGREITKIRATVDAK